MARKSVPGNMARTDAKRSPTSFAAETANLGTKGVSPAEDAARRTAKAGWVSAFVLNAHQLQPAERHSTVNVGELKASVRKLGLLEPPLVRRRTDGEWQILAGHRRAHAWRLLAAEGIVDQKMRVWILQDVDDQEALRIVSAEYFHRREFGTLHTARLVGETYRAMTGSKSTVTLREMEAVLPLGRTALGHYLTIYNGLQDPRLAPLVHAVDKPRKASLYRALSQDTFASKVAALEALQKRGTRKRGPRAATATQNSAGSPSPVTRRDVDGGFDLEVRVRDGMSDEAVVEVCTELRRVLRDLKRRRTGITAETER